MGGVTMDSKQLHDECLNANRDMYDAHVIAGQAGERQAAALAAMGAYVRQRKIAADVKIGGLVAEEEALTKENARLAGENAQLKDENAQLKNSHEEKDAKIARLEKQVEDLNTAVTLAPSEAAYEQVLKAQAAYTYGQLGGELADQKALTERVATHAANADQDQEKYQAEEAAKFTATASAAIIAEIFKANATEVAALKTDVVAKDAAMTELRDPIVLVAEIASVKRTRATARMSAGKRARSQ